MYIYRYAHNPAHSLCMLSRSLLVAERARCLSLYVYAHTCARVHTHTHIYTYTHTHAYTHVHTRAYTHVHTHTYMQVRNLLVAERERLFAGLKAIPFLEPYPSHSNFILAKV